MNDCSHPIRVLHVVMKMNRGGIETWLMHMLRAINKKKVHCDFLVHSTVPGEFDAEIEVLGSKILRCPVGGNPLLYTCNLVKLLRKNPAYDVIHSHVHHFSGWILFIAAVLGIPVRIAHSHSDTAFVDANASFSRKIYLRFMKKLINRYATIGLAVSEKAADAIKGGSACRLKWQVIYCGIDLAPFLSLPDKALLRQEIGIPASSIVLGHVGNFNLAKNHQFILRVAGKLIKLNPDSYLVLVGDGSLFDSVKESARLLGIDSNIRFLGTREDIPNILGMVDVFLFPSIFEGLSLAILEAQAAGLPVVISDSVTMEADVVPGLLRWVSLSQPPAEWAQVCLEAYRERKDGAQQNSCEIMSKTSFDILNNICEIENLYCNRQVGSVCAKPIAADTRTRR